MKHTTRKFIILSLLLLMALSACRVEKVVSPTDVPKTQEPTKPSAETLVPSETPTAFISPTSAPSATPAPPAFWKGTLPLDLQERIFLPDGAVWASDENTATYSIVASVPEKLNTHLASTQWTYALVAPFFTVRDDISLSDLQFFLMGKESESPDLSDRKVLLDEGDYDSLIALLGLSNPSDKVLKKVARDAIFADPWGDDWAIVPFDALQPGWKVLAIDGISPLDHDFNPDKYALTLHVTIESKTENNEQSASMDFSGILPVPNRDETQLTSLIMTGVTAMARDTAYVMETQGVLFPGTEIRDILRAADLTHISNEVSFYEGCAFPNPDYKGFIFCSNPEYIKLLDDLGADIIELTGNHNNDVLALYKVDSVPFTLELYEQYGMRWYAGGVNVEDAKAPLLIEHNGNKLAFIGCNSYGPEMAWATESGSGAAPCEDFSWLKAEVARLRAEGYLPIVTFQFQEDYFREASSLQLRDFRDVATAGPVIVNGSQSHVAKAMEFYEGVFIDYGLGNLFFDQPEFYITYDSFIQEHHFYQGRHISTKLYTITIEETGKPRPMTDEERSEFLAIIFSVSEPLRRTQ